MQIQFRSRIRWKRIIVFILKRKLNWRALNGRGFFHSFLIDSSQSNIYSSFCYVGIWCRTTLWRPAWDQTRVRYWKSDPLRSEAIFSLSFWENKTKTNNCGTLYLRRWWQPTCDANHCYATLEPRPLAVPRAVDVLVFFGFFSPHKNWRYRCKSCCTMMIL